MNMLYRRLGKSGLKVSALSFGAWVTFGKQIDDPVAKNLLHTAYDAGVNFFDNAEAYADGQAEVVMGAILKNSGWRRSSYSVSSKVFFGAAGDLPNETGLSRKHVVEACHCARLGLYAPTMEQPQYNLFHRAKVEKEFSPLYKKHGLGTTIWSPLASGLLTGKYNKGVPAGSRLQVAGLEWLKDRVVGDDAAKKQAAVEQLSIVAKELGTSLPKLGVAWCLKNEYVSTVILGASKVEQLQENLGALDVVEKLTPDVLKRIDKISQPIAE